MGFHIEWRTHERQEHELFTQRRLNLDFASVEDAVLTARSVWNRKQGATESLRVVADDGLVWWSASRST